MNFAGFQKLTLLDFPGKVACILFTRGCNFRCPFCHNASLVTHFDDTVITEDEVFAFLKKRQGILEGVVISGGEPMLNADLPDFIRKVKALGYAVKIDTNGTNPAMLKSCLEEGIVDYVAMDIKNSSDKYALTAGVEGFDGKVKESMDYLLSSDYQYEFRTTVTKELHTPKDVEDIAIMIKGAPKYYIQNFADSGDILSEGMNPLDEEGLARLLEAAQKHMPNAQIRG